MSNSFFQFKQFTVFQDQCAMKVCTDASLFGAIVAHCPLPVSHCLDIGTGTGLLSLLFAQKNPGAIIDAVEIDAEAAEQAGNNFSISPWKERLHIFNSDILYFKTDKKYDLILSNPPFFENDLHSPDESKNHAKHDTSLGLVELIQVLKDHLAMDGSFAVLLPYHRVNYFIEEAEKRHLYLTRQVLVRQTENHDHFRGILFFSREKIQPINSTMSIKDRNGSYTPEFASALKDYYLYL